MNNLAVNHNLIEMLRTKRIAVAVSGGSDSMALLHFVIENKFTDFFVVNFEHGIRGESSIKDSDFVLNYCKDRNIQCRVVPLNTLDEVARLGLTVEETARKLRYEYFDTLLKDDVDYVLLAHHKQDQVETILMRIFRGTGIDGLEGIKQINNGIVRPFLYTDKSDIMAYIKENNIPYVEDETNQQNVYTRNFIRNELLPKIKEKYPKAEDSIVRLADIARGVNEYLDKQISVEIYDENTVAISADIVDKELLVRAVKKAYLTLGITKDIETRHYELILKLQGLNNGVYLDMPYKTRAYKEYDKIVIEKIADNQNINILLELPLKCDILHDKVRIVRVDGNVDVKNGLYFDGDKIPKGAVLRYRKPEDYFTKFGGGTKSLGDYFTDKKIPIRLRDKIVVCAHESEVLFIVGVAISDKVKIDNKSKNIYEITTEKKYE